MFRSNYNGWGRGSMDRELIPATIPLLNHYFVSFLAKNFKKVKDIFLKDGRKKDKRKGNIEEIYRRKKIEVKR